MIVRRCLGSALAGTWLALAGTLLALAGALAGALAAGCSSSGRTGSADLAGTGAHVGSGAVSLYQTPKMPSGLGVAANASFRRESAPSPLIPCTTSMVAGCAARSCTFIQDLGVAPPLDPVSAGVVSVMGGSAPLTITPAGDGTYPAASANDLWHGGESLTATAPGSVAPGFTIAIMAPALVTFTAPAGPVTLPSGQDLVLSTTSTDTMTVGYHVIFDQTMPVSTLDVTCVLTGAGGSVTMPAAALALAPAGKDFSVSASITSASRIDLSGWSIAFSATSVATFPGQRSSLVVKLQ
ncbi:MAG: hypothetical protein JWM53_3527 [bacterium]|nr:hypothetical protein [bacterium]